MARNIPIDESIAAGKTKKFQSFRGIETKNKGGA